MASFSSSVDSRNQLAGYWISSAVKGVSMASGSPFRRNMAVSVRVSI
jgi:hypothetical protein